MALDRRPSRVAGGVTVHITGDGDRRMAQQISHGFDVNTGFEPGHGGAVAQGMDADAIGAIVGGIGRVRRGRSVFGSLMTRWPSTRLMVASTFTVPASKSTRSHHNANASPLRNPVAAISSRVG